MENKPVTIKHEFIESSYPLLCRDKVKIVLPFGGDGVRFLRSKRKQQDAALPSTLVAAEVIMMPFL